MKFMIASDLHGSEKYGALLFERYEEEKPEKLILLGDLLYHGARNALPEAYSTIDRTALLNAHRDQIFAVRGNCDSEVDQTVLEFPIQADYNMMYVDGHQWILTHGHLFDEHSMIWHDPGAVLLHGHTHVKAMECHGDFYYLNPGSVSIPKDAGYIHSYLVYEDLVFTMKDVTNGRVLGTLSID